MEQKICYTDTSKHVTLQAFVYMHFKNPEAHEESAGTAVSSQGNARWTACKRSHALDTAERRLA